MTQRHRRRRLFRILLSAALLVAGASPVAAITPAADYDVTFDATWTAATHPVDFPPGPHFSPLVTAIHNDQVSFWLSGTLASQGIEDMAELGATSPLDDEISAAIVAGTAVNMVIVPGINSPGQQTLSVSLTQSHPRLTLVSMLAPSPDWFIGVSGVDLIVAGDWVDELVIDLRAYDAGTDNGVTYLSPDDDTVPQENISLLTEAPFVGSVPVGTLTITRTDEPPPPMHDVPALSPLASGILVASLAGVVLARGRVRRPAIAAARRRGI